MDRVDADGKPLIVFRRGQWRLTARGRKVSEALERRRLEAEALAAHQEVEREAQRIAWVEEGNREYWQRKRQIAESNARRRARLAGAPINDLTEDQWDVIQASWGFRCAYCGVRGVELTKDHVVPLAAGGDHTAANIVPACLPCNAKKGTKTAPRFLVTPKGSQP